MSLPAMPAPGMGPTHFTSSGSGLNWNLQTPQSFFSRPNAPFSMNNASINNYTEITSNRITVPLKIAALSGNEQMDYAETSILFLYNPKRGLTTETYVAFDIPTLNYYLEKAQVEKAINGGVLPKSHPLEGFPTTVEEFTQKMIYFGHFNSCNDKKGVRQRSLGVIVDRSTKSAYIFPPKNGKLIGTGTFVGLRVGFIDNPYTSFVGLDGKPEGTKTPGKILQVTGHWEPDCNQPIHCTKFMEPADGDLDFMMDVSVEQREYKENKQTGLIDFDSGASSKVEVLNIKQYGQSLYIPLGRVMWVSKHPSDYEINMGLRSTESWNKLRQHSTIVIELDQHTFKHIY